VAETTLRAESPTLTLQIEPVFDLTLDQLYELCRINEDLRIERTARGELEIMPPAGGGSGHRGSKLTAQIETWAERDGSGFSFDSSTGFVLPNGAMRSPDASWVRRERLAALSPQQKERFLPLCPDFVVELRSPSDPLAPAEAKMREYMANGARLGWLIDPATRRVHVYREGGEVELLEDPASISGDPVLPGFSLRLAPIFSLDW
jgi:Uma2 family endonuclease